MENKAVSNTAAQTTAGQAIIHALEMEGVEFVFGIPGTHNLELYKHLAASSSIKHIVFRHEQGAVFAADAYARRTGKPGVVITTSGPGALNALSSIANSYADGVPVLLIAPSVLSGREQEDFGWIHEVKNQLQALDAVTDRAVRCYTAERAAQEIHDTFSRWNTERTRPVALEVPVDVLEQGFPPVFAKPWSVNGSAAPSAEMIREIAAKIQQSTNPVILVGGGAIKAASRLKSFAEAIDAPVFATGRAKGVLSEKHPLSAGTEFFTRSGRAMIAEADLLIVVGTKLGETELRDRPLETEAYTVRVDIHAKQLEKRIRSDVKVIADSDEFFAALNTELTGQTPVSLGGQQRVAEFRRNLAEDLQQKLAPWQQLHQVLRDSLDETAVILGDSSQVTYKGTVHLWPAVEPNQVISPVTFATLGYSVPAAIGAKIAQPERQVLSLVGDGAFMFSLQELVTAVEQKLGIVVIVVDNGGYFEIKEEMADRGFEPLAVDLLNPDFAALAQAMGCEAESIADDYSRLPQILSTALTRNVPTIIHTTVSNDRFGV